MKQYLLLSTVLALLMSSHAWAEDAQQYPKSGSCGANEGDCNWVLDANGKLTITGTGPMSDFTYSSTPWKDYREKITEIEMSGITHIGRRAFYNTRQTNLIIPASVETIEAGAFFYSPTLSNVVFEEGSKLKSIGGEAFRSCPNLTQLELPNSVEYLDFTNFYDTGIEGLLLPESLFAEDGSIGLSDDAFGKSMTIYCPDGHQAQCAEYLTTAQSCTRSSLNQKNPDCVPIPREEFNLQAYKKTKNGLELLDDKGRTIGEYANVKDLYNNNSLKDYVVNPDDSISVYDKTGKLIDKRYAKIYTVEEIMEITKGKDKFHVSLTYK